MSWITVEPRFHDVVALDLRPRPLHPAEHHAARADGAADSRQRTGTRSCTSRRRSSVRREACSSRPNRPHFHLALATAPAGPVKMEILDAARQGDEDADGLGACRAERDQLGSPARGAEARRAADDAARQSAHLGRGAVQGRADPPHHALGHHAVDRHPAWRRPASTRSGFTVDGTALHAAVRSDQGSGDRVVGRGSADLDGDADADPRRPDATSEMVNQMELWRKQIEDQVEDQRREGRRS